LCALVAATQQNDYRIASLLEIDALARAVVDSQLAHSLPYGFGIASMTVREAILAGGDQSSGRLVLESRSPFPERFRLLKLHRHQDYCSLQTTYVQLPDPRTGEHKNVSGAALLIAESCLYDTPYFFMLSFMANSDAKRCETTPRVHWVCWQSQHHSA